MFTTKIDSSRNYKLGQILIENTNCKYKIFIINIIQFG